MTVFQVEGDSAYTGAPDSLRDGDFVFVDTSQREPVEGKLFVVQQHGNGHLVKRARKIADNRVFLSDNPNYGPMSPEEIEICGMVYKAVGERSFQATTGKACLQTKPFGKVIWQGSTTRLYSQYPMPRRPTPSLYQHLFNPRA